MDLIYYVCMCFADDKENPDYRRILRHIELIDDEASEYGITIVKSTDKLMAKKYGYRKLPGLTYFRKGISAVQIFANLHYYMAFTF